MGFLSISDWLHINNKLIDFGKDKNTKRDEYYRPAFKPSDQYKPKYKGNNSTKDIILYMRSKKASLISSEEKFEVEVSTVTDEKFEERNFGLD